jgi:predicted GIY-YIG superfamily endonuclease
VYLPDGIVAHEDLLARLGPHTTGVGCLYLKDLEKVDLAVLEEIVRRSWATVTSGTFGRRAREF